MASIKRFEDLQIWLDARILEQDIIRIVKSKELKNNFKLRAQITSSAGSIIDNIAEDFERNGNLEFRQFLSIAKGSAGETRSQLYRVYDWGYIEQNLLDDLTLKCEQLSKQIAGFINYLNKTELKGSKFQGKS
ncbi:four helix bundle protein [Leeuwenhoekiella aestuarii]|uniref:Four helix bundle protein n=1 Tax=Leeuwenhoekiella aestuarii TaxID=2249426 RepID=A0A4Q0NT25_9FLAO|nr:four helix bundle protein [Leeuwenhoekiella aestuarii]RXG14249.1 four helix bundle protein [Leeuwenhoekiella aestuarii]RXG18998.1 four helix bundle protein [Leeuwenhoekiella aestuarii]